MISTSAAVDPRREKYRIDVLAKAFALLDLVADRPATLAELADSLGATKSTTFRLLANLEVFGFVRRQPSGRYSVGSKPLELSRTVLPDPLLETFAQSALAEVQAATAEGGEVCVRDGFDSLVIASRAGTQLHMVNIPPGMRVPLHCGASAKVLLAFGPPAVANEYLAREHLARLTPQTHSSVPPLREELASIRVQGYAFSRGEVDADLWAVGAPILDAHGNLTAALSVVAPLSRGSHEQVDKARRAILATSMAFSRRLGFGSDPTATEEVIGERG